MHLNKRAPRWQVIQEVTIKDLFIYTRPVIPLWKIPLSNEMRIVGSSFQPALSSLCSSSVAPLRATPRHRWRTRASAALEIYSVYYSAFNVLRVIWHVNIHGITEWFSQTRLWNLNFCSAALGKDRHRLCLSPRFIFASLFLRNRGECIKIKLYVTGSHREAIHFFSSSSLLSVLNLCHLNNFITDYINFL